MRRQIIPTPNEGTGEDIEKKQKDKRESHEAKCRREYGEYTSLAKTKIAKVVDGYVTFCQNFK